MTLIHSNFGKILLIVLVAAFLISLLAILFHTFLELLPSVFRVIKLAVAALLTAIALGLAASLRGRQEIEHPWQIPRTWQEQQLDDDEGDDKKSMF